ncbi:MAG: TrkA family potassium uptake protein, partial [SAR202 cluster bacterium]|nr:TrkA family potassium uptake protein [SAR202 cluster bacterium]
ERLVQDVMGQVTYAVRADVTSEAVLRELGVPNFDAAVVAIGEVPPNLMATVLLKSLGVRNVVARAQTPIHGQTLLRIGASRVVFPEQEAGSRAAHNLFSPEVVEYMELGAGTGVSKLQVPRPFINLTLKDAGLSTRDRYHITVVAIRRGNDLLLLPSEDERLRASDILVVAAQDESLERLHPQE